MSKRKIKRRKKVKYDPKKKRSYEYANGNDNRISVNTSHIRYKSSTGAEVVFSPLPPALYEKLDDALEEEMPTPQVPTYEEVLGGKTGPDAPTQVFEHTEDTEKDEQEQAEWDAYVEGKRERDAELASRFLRAIQVRCIHPEVSMDDDAQWIQEQIELQLVREVPSNPIKRKLHWIETEFIGNQDDISACIMVPLELAGTPPEELDALEDMFRAAVSGEVAQVKAR
jgi:hypothetical protein